MPATSGRKTSTRLAVGVDGCRAGWVAVAKSSHQAPQIEVFRDFATLLNSIQQVDPIIIVDMPIGLAEHGRRACEALARKRLGRYRASSVFSSPRRPMLGFDNYASANAWGQRQGKTKGGGLSKQAWNITPKIRELDAIIDPSRQSLVGEGHPEVAFYRLNGMAPCLASKRTAEGKNERRSILASNGLTKTDELFETARAQVGGLVGSDDVLDACALALTAEARLTGKALRLSDDARDARGLIMEIWG